MSIRAGETLERGRARRTGRLAIVVLALLLAACGKKAGQPGPAGGEAVAAAPTQAATDRSHDPAGCADPTWAPQRIVGFSLDSCETKAWMAMDVQLADGSKRLEGRRASVHFNLTDQTKNPTAAAARLAVVQQALKAGARLASADGGYNAVLTQKTSAGEFWYIYEHGDGNETSTGGYTLTTVQITPLPQEVQARPMTAALDAKNHTCQDPPWLARQFSYFKVSSCENKAWDVVTLHLAGGDRTLQGARTSVYYDLTDEKLSPTALAITRNYVNALQAIGAQRVSDPNDVYLAILTQKTPVGEFWYVARHGNGNEDSTDTYSLTTIAITPFPQEVQAQPMQGPLAPKDKAACANPPWLVKQFSYFNVTGCGYRDFDQVKIDLPGGARTLVGHVLVTDFTLADRVQDPTPLTVKTNYLNALQAIGATQASDPANVDQTAMTQKTGQGELWYLIASTSGNDESTGSYELTTVQIGGPPPKTCTLEVYGVNFDFDKAALRPDSEPVLNQVLALFTGDPQYVAEVGGHTDNIGQSGYNLKLSAARADAVRAWLTAHGVAPARLTSKGYGDTRPLVPNTTDENRAKNRRVELKRANCKM